jgi:hypothetical protein
VAEGASAAGPSADRAIRDLEELRRRLEREIRRRLLSLDTQRGSDSLQGDRDALATAVRTRQQIVNALTDEGQRVVVDIASRRALEAAAAIVGGAEVSSDARAEIDRIVRGQTADIAAVFADAADEMRRAINAGISTGGSLGDLVEEVARVLDTSVVRASAAVDAAIMASGRRALMLEAKASGLPYVYAYVGPGDAKNRDFCRQFVGRAVTLEYMARLDNGQGLPVRDYCGGYNCRHSWAPLLRADAIAEGIQVLG